ncbi:MAG: 16S rRNA (adenine(1518)-N(6)/adenine(1519)-N(6))-dimethyltransferase RsmA [Holosporales bacterium]|jgi:16S rRNA (adenine1518-N6/adenine1519-N6)-dimethyltransferase|nr:16S rRNA (adenine(1518)-N(6)/adenine(1519)-N(6))-dimethyltransferase RsmA [Holosporales bacterium]
MDDENDLELTVAQIINKYDLCRQRGRLKAYGQNFLLDGSLLRKIAGSAFPIGADDAIIEVGPGPCGLLRAIMEYSKANEIYCIEKDTLFKPIHDNLVAHIRGRTPPHFVYEDALKVKLQSLTNRHLVVISNLPYNVGSKLLVNWLSDLTRINKMVLMFQREVADRICADAGTKEYGRLSIISQLLCKTEKLFNVSCSAFVPKPKVTSAVVRLTPHSGAHVENMANIERLTADCFRHRRKTMSKIISRYYGVDAIAALDNCDIDKLARPENVPPLKFLALATALCNVTRL